MLAVVFVVCCFVAATEKKPETNLKDSKTKQKKMPRYQQKKCTLFLAIRTIQRRRRRRTIAQIIQRQDLMPASHQQEPS